MLAGPVAVVMPPAEAAGSAAQCHLLAADPDDPMRDRSFSGVPDGALEPGAVEACRAAVAESPSDPVLNYQLARALLEQGAVDEARNPLTLAAEAGEPGALYLYALVLQEQGGGTADDVGAILDRSREGGYAPAAEAREALRNLANQEAGGAPADYSRFERPDIIEALVAGNADYLRNVKIGIVGEDLAGPMGFIKYYEGFSGALTNPYICPVLLPAGAGELMTVRLMNRVFNQSQGDPLANPMVTEGMGMLLGQVKRMYEDPGRYMGGLVAGEASIAVLGEQGTKDGYQIKALGDRDPQAWGCDGVHAQAISQTVRALIQ